jgi:hypothetical protein
MEYKINEIGYNPIFPGTIGIAQKISSDYMSAENEESESELSKLSFLVKNKVMECSHNQF